MSIRIAPTNMFLSFGKSSQVETRSAKKTELLDSLKGLQRGAAASSAEKERVEKLASDLERLNPTRDVLSKELSARWKLLYTTSDSIIGTKRPPFLRPFGPIFQSIDTATLRARNQETLPFFNSVDAELVPINKKKVKVQFKRFSILGLIPVTAPASAQGELEVTYLDDELRISRGNKGNLFILERSGKPQI